MQVDIRETQPSPAPERRAEKPPRRWVWALIALFLIGSAIILGSVGGYLSAERHLKSQQVALASSELQQQYNLGVSDLEAGRYEVAKQRFEYIISIDPQYPGAMEMLAQSMQVLYATATPSPPPATALPTATRDQRPIEELYNQAQTQISSQDWNGAIDTLAALRKEATEYQTASVDGMLFLALRGRGVVKILQGGNLEGGIYDLAQAERFGPLDVEANQARQWARLYIYGLSFWEVHPEQAVYYFSQVAAAMPYLSDASGWTASDRYRAVLIQYGDLLADQGAWCEAMQQYQLAMAIRSDPELQTAFEQTAERCLALTVTPTLSATPVLTTTGTVPVLTTTATITPSPTLTNQPTATSTPEGITPTASATPEAATPPTETATSPGNQPTATNTEVPPPSATPEGQETPYPGAISDAYLIAISQPNEMHPTDGRNSNIRGLWFSLIQKLKSW